MFGKLMVAVVAIVTAAIFFIYLKDPYSPGPSQTESASDAASDSPITSPNAAALPSTDSGDSVVAGDDSADVGSSATDTAASNPFSTDAANAEGATEAAPASNVSADTASESDTSSVLDYSNAEIAGVSIYDVGRDNWLSDEQFEEMQAQLAANPELLQALLDQVRTETDPERLKRLTQLIGKLDDTLVTEAAREMLYSGNPDAQLAALDMLRQTQGGNSTARDVLVDVIGVEQDPRVLNVALNAFATPGAISGAQRQGILDNVSNLATHYDANIRARSYSLLATYTDSAAMTPTILQGLNDPDPKVRGKVAHSLLGYNYPDDSVREELIRVAENSNEQKSTRQASLQALGRMSLTEEQRARLRLANEDVSRAPNR